MLNLLLERQHQHQHQHSQQPPALLKLSDASELPAFEFSATLLADDLPIAAALERPSKLHKLTHSNFLQSSLGLFSLPADLGGLGLAPDTLLQSPKKFQLRDSMDTEEYLVA